MEDSEIGGEVSRLEDRFKFLENALAVHRRACVDLDMLYKECLDAARRFGISHWLDFLDEGSEEMNQDKLSVWTCGNYLRLQRRYLGDDGRRLSLHERAFVGDLEAMTKRNLKSPFKERINHLVTEQNIRMGVPGPIKIPVIGQKILDSPQPEASI